MAPVVKIAGESGSVLLEAVYAAGLVLLLATFVLPAFILSAATASKNESRTIAANIAAQEVERIKSLTYDEVGVIGGNPLGVITPDSARAVGTATYSVKTRIRYVDDPQDGSGVSDPDPRDYKQVTVTVYWTVNGRTSDYKLITRVSRESFDQIAAGGNILVNARDAIGNLLEDVRIEITAGPSGVRGDWTDEGGQVLFAMLPESVTEGDYSLTASKNSYVVRPDLLVQTTTVARGEQRIVEFIVERPGALNVRLVDPLGNIVQKHSRLTLLHPDAGELIQNGPDGDFTIDALYPGTWQITPFAASYQYDGDPVAVEVTPGFAQTVTITLTPRPQGNLHLTVLDSLSASPLQDVAVTVVNLSTGESVTASTNGQGVLQMPLEVGAYRITIDKPNYLSQTVRADISGAQNTVLAVNLSRAPAVGSILVRTLRTADGQPRAGIRVRVYRNADRSRQEGQTDVNGRIIFADLTPGTYTAYRWSAGWRFPRRVTVTAGQQREVLYTW